MKAVFKFIIIFCFFINSSVFAAGKCDSASEKVNVKCDDKEMEKEVNEEIGMATALCASSTGSGAGAKAECMKMVRTQYIGKMDQFEGNCTMAEKECDSSCTKPEEQEKKNQCKKKAAEGKSAAKGAKEQAKKAGAGGDDMAKMLGALAGLASMFKKDDEKKEEAAQTASTPTAPADRAISSGGNFASGGYRTYTAGDKGDGKSELGAQSANLAESKGGSNSGGKAGAASSGGGGGFNTGGGASGVAAAVAPANAEKEEGLDKNLGEGFFSGGGAGGKNDPGEYSSGGGGYSQPFAQSALEGGSSSYSKQKLQSVLDHAKSIGRSPAGLAHFGANGDGTGPHGDNFNRVHERYRMINFSEQLEDVD